ncbi:hypothetical protein ZWY2020_031250 [Hordeum vulgare]|nr:hypothetical protein ZWY2020_031250 [Hordeum vulgare]
MERSSTPAVRRVALLLALIVCCSMVSSTAATQVSLHGSREGQRPPSPSASGGRSVRCPGCGRTSSLPATARHSPHRKNLQVAANVNFYA